MAHRGASKSAPENTLAAFRAARSAGADLYELDVQQTKDQELVVIHDATLARTTNAEEVFPDRSPWRVRDFTLAELRQLDAGSWFGARYAGEPIPTLSDVLRVMKGTPGLLLEVKRPAGAPGWPSRWRRCSPRLRPRRSSRASTGSSSSHCTPGRNAPSWALPRWPTSRRSRSMPAISA